MVVLPLEKLCLLTFYFIVTGPFLALELILNLGMYEVVLMNFGATLNHICGV
jgi:hypothetical protein